MQKTDFHRQSDMQQQLRLVEGIQIDIPVDNRGINEFAMTMLKRHGHNVTAVWHVYPASNRLWTGYEVVLYASYDRKRTGFVWFEGGRLQIKTVDGWFEEAGPPPKKS